MFTFFSKFIRSVCLCLFLAIVSTESVFSNEMGSIATINQNPFTKVYGIPPIDTEMNYNPGSISMALTLDYVNNAQWAQQGSEELFIDGETQTWQISLRYVITPRMEVGLDVPFIRHFNGVFDGFIHDWHEFFNLPNNHRKLPYKKDGRLNYSYFNADGLLLDINQAEKGMGDIRLKSSFSLLSSPYSSKFLIVHYGLELPSGETNKLLGSGSYDWFTYLSGQSSEIFESRLFGLYGGIGTVYVAGGDLLPSINNEFIVFGTAGISLQVFNRSAIKIQMDAHSAVYDSSISALGADSYQLVIGGVRRFQSSYSLEIALVENLFTDAIPDVSIHLSLGKSFN